jgi:hypothetical protein
MHLLDCKLREIVIRKSDRANIFRGKGTWRVVPGSYAMPLSTRGIFAIVWERRQEMFQDSHDWHSGKVNAKNIAPKVPYAGIDIQVLDFLEAGEHG